MNALKIATAGSVDDGKSTLIGRLLYDTKSLPKDKIEAIANSSKKKGYDYLDFSLATDGLVAEREQGITIDVAHIYFSTDNRSYIIADTPGHIEYTRNMVTGASTAQVAIILVDARNGVVEQTYRHFFINNLLNVQNIIIAINKMDLVNYNEENYKKIKEDINSLKEKSNSSQEISYVPISALNGDNVASSSSKMKWYKGKTILEQLEEIKTINSFIEKSFRFQVQTVIRPKTEDKHDFRGYAGRVHGDKISVGDEVVIQPSQTTSKIKSIHFFGEEYTSAEASTSPIITLEDNIDISRGDLITKKGEEASSSKKIKAKICWMDRQKLLQNKKYFFQIGTKKVLAKVTEIENTIPTDFSEVKKSKKELQLNDIGTVQLSLNKEVAIDSFNDSRSNGAFILIDSISNTTAGVGFIQ